MRSAQTKSRPSASWRLKAASTSPGPTRKKPCCPRAEQFCPLKLTRVMLRLLIPGNVFEERRYIGDLILNRFLGLDVQICQNSAQEVVLMNENAGRLVMD